MTDYLDESGQVATKTYLDDSGNPLPKDTPQSQALQGAVSFAAQQSPDHYAKMIQFQKLTGIPPVVSKGNEEQVQQAVDSNKLDPRYLTTIAPNVSAWASNHDNAAVSGVDEIHRLAGIEQNAVGMKAYTPTTWDTVRSKVNDAYGFLTGGQTLDTFRERFYENPLTRGLTDVVGGAAGLIGNVGSFLGIHGADGKKNLLQRVETNLSPEMNTDPASLFHKSNEFDWLMKNVAPMVPAIIASGGTSALANTLKVSPTAAKVLTGLTVGAGFTADQAGKTYTAVKESGGSDYDARLASNRVAAINALPNSLFGATDVVPFLRDNPLLTSVGIGSLTGATGQVSQNVVTGRPTLEGVPSAALQGAAIQGGMHLATDVFFNNLNQAVASASESPLRERSQEKFQEANEHIFAGQESFRINADRWNEYFTSKNLNPVEAAQSVGAQNYAEAVTSGGEIEVPKANYLSQMDAEHQQGLLPDVIDPHSGLSQREVQQGREELQQWVAGGGPDTLIADTAATDAETQSSPEWKAVHQDLRQRYIDAGETPEVADTLATNDANVYSNIAKSASLKPSELVALYNPRVVVGEAPEEALNQGDASSPKGWFKVNSDGSYEIGRTQIGDLSTFSHESSHAYLKIISDLAAKEGASDVLKRDHERIMEWLGVKDGEELTTEQQEKWARANEQYLREGKAPSSKLRGAFQRFGVWLQSIYKKASDLGVELSDDIRGVLDRLYAAEEGVDQAAKDAGPAMFTSAEEAGWTEEQYQSYAEEHALSVEQAKERILAKLNDARLRERTTEWREEERNARAALTEQVDRLPQYAAIRALRKGALDDGTELSLNREELVKQFGEQRVKDLQKAHPGLYRNEGGADAETAAELLGYSSAEEMMRGIEQAPRRSVAIDSAVRDYMTAKHGDIRYDGTLTDQARIALENDQRADTLHKELRALKEKLAKVKGDAAEKKQALRDIAVAPIEAYRAAAAQAIEAKQVADLQPTRYLDASRKYSREAFDAVRRGNAEEAANAKHKELLNHFLFREATKAKVFVGKFESYVQRAQGKSFQAQLGLAGQDFRDQFNGILARYQLGPYMGQPERNLTDWSMAQFDDGYEPAIDPVVLNEARTLNWRNAPVSEVRSVHDALVNIRKIANLQLGMEVNGRKVDFAESVKQMTERAANSITPTPRPVFDENRTRAEKTSDLVDRGAALLKRTEFLMNRLDGGAEGPWHDYLWNLAADSQGKEYELQESVTKTVGEALQKMAKEERLRLTEKVAIEGIYEPVTRKRMISMALNMGNEGNLDRLSKTFEAFGWDQAAIEKVRNSLTAQEWGFVQDVWNSLKPLGAAQMELERRLTGLTPVMVKPEPFDVTLADGSEMHIDGGYYPIVMDSRYSQQGAQPRDAGQTAQNMMEAGYGRATTSRGSMKERTGYGGPLLLDHEQVLTQHTAKVVKDISHREFMLAANKLIMNSDVRRTLQDTVGPATEAQLMPWLRTIVNDRNGSTVQGLGDVSRAMTRLRTNIVKAALGFKFSTLLLQVTHASSIFLHTTPGSYAQAMIDFVAHPFEMSEQIRELSPNEMSGRGENIDRDMRKVLQESVSKKSIGDAWAKIGMAPVQFMDHIMSFPLWLSVYRNALEEHADLSESEAKYKAMHKADGAVRMGLGSNAPKDLAPIMRNNDLTKFLTTMGGFHNLKWNQLADTVTSYRDRGGIGKMTYGLIMAGIIPAVAGAWISGRGPEDGENPALWAAKKALLFPAETVALLNIGVEALENRGDVRLSPIVSAIEREGKAVSANAEDQDTYLTNLGITTLQNVMEAAGISGTDQMFRTGRYLKKAAEGEVENPNPWDAIATGNTKK